MSGGYFPAFLFGPRAFGTTNTTIYYRIASVREMKRVITAIFVLCLSFAALAQDPPITQPEFVKMLNALPKNPGLITDIITALRKRGIDFVVTDGIRSYARTKGANDEDLKRALEEAGRRQKDPAGAQLPSPKEANELLAKATKKTLDAVGDMPDFVVKQQIQRSAAYAGTNNFRNLDRLVVAVSYRSNGDENYKILSMNGILQNATESKGSYEEAGGTSSTGEFVTLLATIFKPESQTQFAPLDTDLLRGRKSMVFEFFVEKDRAKQMITAVGTSNASTIAGVKGRIWIDREDARVLRIESEATDIPANFPIRTARRTIDYAWVTIEEEKYLLPSLSDVRLTMRESSKVFETRNLIRFVNYQKYGSVVRVLDDDTKPEPEPPIKP